MSVNVPTLEWHDNDSDKSLTHYADEELEELDSENNADHLDVGSSSSGHEDIGVGDGRHEEQGKANRWVAIESNINQAEGHTYSNKEPGHYAHDEGYDVDDEAENGKDNGGCNAYNDEDEKCGHCAGSEGYNANDKHDASNA